MRERTMARYGVCCDIPARLPGYPEPTPLYGVPTDDTTDHVAEHGEWCARRCVYPANEARIREVMAA